MFLFCLFEEIKYKYLKVTHDNKICISQKLAAILKSEKDNK